MSSCTSIEWQRTVVLGRIGAMQSTWYKILVSLLRTVLAFVPLTLFVLAPLNYAYWIMKYRVHPSFPPYSDPISAVLGAGLLAITGFVISGPLWLVGTRPRWVLLTGCVLNGILLTLMLLVIFHPIDNDLFRRIRTLHYL
jgi:hypothetical protein